MNPDDLPTRHLMTLLGVSIATGNPLVGGLAAGGLALTEKTLAALKGRFQKWRESKAMQQREIVYRAEREAQRHHELELERLRNLLPPPPKCAERLFAEARARSESRKRVIAQLPLTEDERRRLEESEDERFLVEVEGFLFPGDSHA